MHKVNKLDREKIYLICYIKFKNAKVGEKYWIWKMFLEDRFYSDKLWVVNCDNNAKLVDIKYNKLKDHFQTLSEWRQGKLVGLGVV